MQIAQATKPLSDVILEAAALNPDLIATLDKVPVSELDRAITDPQVVSTPPITDEAEIDAAIQDVQLQLPPVVPPIILPPPFKLIVGTGGPDLLIGTGFNDLILGRGGNDLIFGLAGNDILLGETGADYIFGGRGADLLLGGSGNDFLNGEEGNDRLFGDGNQDTLYGSTGNDLLDGGAGSDTADYTTLGQAIILERAGIVNKGNAGEDEILNIETIIGTPGKSNAIDGSTGTSGVTSFSVDLSRNTLTVRNIPGIGNQTFTVKNFVNVTGTANSDFIRGNFQANKLSGDGANDTIYGNSGNDTVSGGGGNDFLAGGDFLLFPIDPIPLPPLPLPIEPIQPIQPIVISEPVSATDFAPVPLPQPIPLPEPIPLPQPIPFPRPIPVPRFDGNDTVSGDAGNDILLGGFGNDLLDGGSGEDTANYAFLSGSITLLAQGEVDKGAFGTDQLLNIERIIAPFSFSTKNTIDGSVMGGGPASFDIDLSVNELTVKGIPGQGDVSFDVFNFNVVKGTANSDEITGNNSANVLTGANVVTPNIDGVEDQDTLTGLGGSDLFIVGDTQTSYYLGGNESFGLEDSATITDFTTGVDKIQLKDGLDYLFIGSNSIWLDKGVNNILDSQDDLIAFVEGTGFDTSGSDFILV